MKEKFTSGEWVARIDDCSACGEFEVVTDINDDGSFYSVAENIYDECDARLIAAAPKMYAELKFLVDRVTFQEAYPVEAKRIEKLLAEARGEGCTAPTSE